MFRALKGVKNWFTNDPQITKIQEDLILQERAIKVFLQEALQHKDTMPEYCTLRQRQCASTGLLMWEKDLKHRYTYVNMRHCNDFYHLPIAHVKTLIGKTDAEAVLDFKKRTGLRHSFGAMCTSTDDITIEKAKPCRFWEIGYINGEILILDIHKQPLYENTRLIGTRGWASNLADRECEIKGLLEMFLKTGEAIPISVNEDKQVAAYRIKKKSNPFNGRFPK